MPRKGRLWFPGAKYHVISRGNRKQSLFYERQDYMKYLSLIHEIKTQYPFKLQSYCLMTNHIHLQIQTVEHNFSICMRWVNSQYAKYFNKKYDFVGHVFESRFKSELILYPDYELEVNRYIHMNPVRANIVKNIEDYPWSSYPAYIGKSTDSLVDMEDINTLLSLFPNPQRKSYQQFLFAETRPFEIIQPK